MTRKTYYTILSPPSPSHRGIAVVRYPRRCVPASLLARETRQKGRMATKRQHELIIHQGLSRYVHTSTSPFSLLQVPIELFGSCFAPLSIHSNLVPTLIAACSLLLLPKNETQFVQITLPTHACVPIGAWINHTKPPWTSNLLQKTLTPRRGSSFSLHCIA